MHHISHSFRARDRAVRLRAGSQTLHYKDNLRLAHAYLIEETSNTLSSPYRYLYGFETHRTKISHARNMELVGYGQGLLHPPRA